MSTLIANRQSLCSLIPHLRGQKVLVVGDVMVDTYVEGDTERISPEAPVPVVNIAREHRMLGGAANVAHNIHALGGEAHLVGMCGAGADGEQLEYLLEQAGICASLLHSSQRKTIVKTRVIARGQQMLRIDKEDTTPLRDYEQTQLCCLLEKVLPNYDILVLSDYAKGLITPHFCTAIHDLIKKNNSPIRMLIDPKPCNAGCYKGAYLLTPNRKEAAELAQISINTTEDIQRAGRIIMDKFDCIQLLITLGSAGMALFMRDGTVWNMPTAAKAVFDVTGAGDTVIATIALALAAGAVLPVACSLANYAAGGAVEKVGVGTLAQDELLQLVQNGVPPEFIHWA